MIVSLEAPEISLPGQATNRIQHDQELCYSIPCSGGKIYKGETGRTQKVRLEENPKAVVRGEIEKSGMADHIWKEKGNHLPLWDKVEIIEGAEHWRIRHLKESAHMLGYNYLLSRLSIE